ncbi:hypothetical protein [Neptunomonas japonica]|uniref:Uncharacterized protein n=1 Tax=Neptunomonas japonica JAMM 1380 TaxID=1441457 RepID=A0A7R6SWQ5_9GAMM|nr:hypothetical protein [Neptunomonas japonica]BBB30899.1 hypothetical protein NEJAP_2959 [Neptunomonas japonica JAMM 1380]
MSIGIISQKTPLTFKALMVIGLSGCIAIVPYAAATNKVEKKRALPAFPIQSFSTGSADDTWVIRTSSAIEYCRSEVRGKPLIQCYQQDNPKGFRFTSVQAVHNEDAGVISAYAMTISGDLVHCRVTGTKNENGKIKSKKLKVNCHL